jgi:hypothetical protein
MNLAADKNQEFGKKVDEFISEVKGECNDPHQKMLSQVYRQFSYVNVQLVAWKVFNLQQSLFKLRGNHANICPGLL